MSCLAFTESDALFPDHDHEAEAKKDKVTLNGENVVEVENDRSRNSMFLNSSCIRIV